MESSSPAQPTKTPRPLKKTSSSSLLTTPGCATYAFITHSPDTLPNNLPPDVDNNALARRRRRRTSQHDQAILEAEYAKNERPDKAARRDITRKVGLGEKEVQIWFQNRRQTNRRKAKPLLPHEMVPKSIICNSALLSSDPITSSETDAVARNLRAIDTALEVMKSEPVDDDLKMTDSPLNSDFDSPMSDDSMIRDEDSSFAESQARSSQIARKASPLRFLLNPAPEAPADGQSTSCASDSNPSKSSRELQLQQRASSTVEPTESENNEGGLAPENSARRVPPLLKRSSSMARLAMDLEGKASVILDEEPTSRSPSSQPPSSQCSSFTEGGQRSQPQRRTVNAKVWEVCCDSRQSSAPPSASKNTTQDTPRKTIKILRARKLVADAKAAAEKRRKKADRKASSDSKACSTLTPRSTNKLAAKLNKVAKSSPKVIDKNRKSPAKNQHSTPKKQRKQMSMIAATPGPLYLKTPESLPRSSQASHDGVESDKENLDPQGNPRVNNSQLAATKAAGDAILKDLPMDVGAGEMECIENLLSLRGGVWG